MRRGHGLVYSSEFFCSAEEDCEVNAVWIADSLVRKQDFSESQSKSESVESFVSDYLKWSKGLHADNTLKCAREAMAKLQRHIGVLSLQEVDQKAVDRLVSGILGERIARSSVNSNLRKIKSAFTQESAWTRADVMLLPTFRELLCRLLPVRLQ